VKAQKIAEMTIIVMRAVSVYQMIVTIIMIVAKANAVIQIKNVNDARM
jgi:hypothetical protein